MEVDILVGADFYWTFVTGKVIRAPQGPTALETRLGWVLSGAANTSESDHTLVSTLVTTKGTVAQNQMDDDDHLNE